MAFNFAVLLISFVSTDGGELLVKSIGNIMIIGDRFIVEDQGTIWFRPRFISKLFNGFPPFVERSFVVNTFNKVAPFLFFEITNIR